MLKPSTKKIYITAGVVLVLLIIANIVGFFWIMPHGKGGAMGREIFSGTVTAIATSSITVTDVRGETKSFVTSSELPVQQGKKIVSFDTVQVGSLVLLSLYPPKDGGEVSVREIKLITTKSKLNKN